MSINNCASIFSPINVVFETIVRRVCNNAAETYGERKETLRYCGVPDGRLQEFRPFRGNKVEDAIHRAIQSNRANQQRNQHDIRKNGKKIGKSPGTFYTLKEYQANRGPADKKAERQFPIWPSDPVVNALFLMQNHSSVNHFILQLIFIIENKFLLYRYMLKRYRKLCV